MNKKKHLYKIERTLLLGLKNMRRLVLCFIIVFLPILSTHPETKVALVIGNAQYINITELNNPVNDAHDVSEELKKLGFQVILKTNTNLAEMEDGIFKLQQMLESDSNSTGLFFYAGHGVQADGVNFLIPIEASIQSSSQLRYRATAVDLILDSMNEAGNNLNIVILDACRDNPFPWNRSASRGLAVASRQPSSSIIMYATGAGDVASDGKGRNGLFTEKLLSSLKEPGLDIQEVFRRTGEAVQKASGGEQNPAIYSQFFGRYSFHRGITPNSSSEPVSASATSNGEPILTVKQSYGSASFSTITAGSLFMNGEHIGELPDSGTAVLDNLKTGTYIFEIRYQNGNGETKKLRVDRNSRTVVGFTFDPSRKYQIGVMGPAGGIIYYDKGHYSDGWRYLEAAPEETEWTGIQWGNRGTFVGKTKIEIGSGKKNTEKIVATFGEIASYTNISEYAAKLCSDLEYNGYDDWFLPSKEELSLMFQYLYLPGIGNFGSEFYWSSSEEGVENAWFRYFDNGFLGNHAKNSYKRVRASRAF